jgi:hypothetical protein
VGADHDDDDDDDDGCLEDDKKLMVLDLRVKYGRKTKDASKGKGKQSRIRTHAMYTAMSTGVEL